MNDSKIKKLFAAAQKETAPEAPFTFSRSVVSAIRREQNQAIAASLFDQLGALFPRLAWAAVVIIGFCVASEFYFSRSTGNSSAEVTQAAEEWLFAAN